MVSVTADPPSNKLLVKIVLSDCETSGSLTERLWGRKTLGQKDFGAERLWGRKTLGQKDSGAERRRGGNFSVFQPLWNFTERFHHCLFNIKTALTVKLRHIINCHCLFTPPDFYRQRSDD